jgi:DNA-binding MarR family transcriptional regulator
MTVVCTSLQTFPKRISCHRPHSTHSKAIGRRRKYHLKITSYPDIICEWPGKLTAGDYRALAEFRYQIRRFLHFSESVARSAGLNPQQHQLLLALKGLPKGVEPNVGEIAQRLFVRHHSAVELTDRLTERQLLRKRQSRQDRRRVLLFTNFFFYQRFAPIANAD